MPGFPFKMYRFTSRLFLTWKKYHEQEISVFIFKVKVSRQELMIYVEFIYAVSSHLIS